MIGSKNGEIIPLAHNTRLLFLLAEDLRLHINWFKKRGNNTIGSNELQRGFRDEVKDCIAKLENRKVAGTDEIVNGFLKYGVDGIVTMIVKLYNWIWKNEDTQTVERTCSSKPLSRKETRLLSTVGKIFCRHSE